MLQRKKSLGAEILFTALNSLVILVEMYTVTYHESVCSNMYVSTAGGGVYWTPGIL